MNLTKKEALRLHHQMWEEMKEEFGDNASLGERVDFKKLFILKTVGHQIRHNCFLCAYAKQKAIANGLDILEIEEGCEFCPIEWRSDDEMSMPRLYACEEADTTWQCSPISEILALKESD